MRSNRRNWIKASAAAAGLAATATAATGGKAAAWSAEYWVNKGAVKLNLFRKRASAPKRGEKPLPVLVFVHGSSLSSRSTFDLSPPGLGEYSMMDVFARMGFDTWTLDHENYGRSSRTDANSDIASGAEDLRAAVALIRKETGAAKVHMFGESSGALRVGAYAMVEPQYAGRLIFAAFTYKGEGSSTLTERAKQLEFYKTHNRRPRDRDMIRSIFTRDKPGTSDPAVAEYLADQELKFGAEVPTGTYLDMTSKLPVVNPKKVLSPVLLIRGEYDGIATMADLMEFYNELPNGDRQFIVLPGAAHSLNMAKNRHLMWHAIQAFLTMPSGVSV